MSPLPSRSLKLELTLPQTNYHVSSSPEPALEPSEKRDGARTRLLPACRLALKHLSSSGPSPPSWDSLYVSPHVTKNLSHQALTLSFPFAVLYAIWFGIVIVANGPYILKEIYGAMKGNEVKEWVKAEGEEDVMLNDVKGMGEVKDVRPSTSSRHSTG